MLQKICVKIFAFLLVLYIFGDKSNAEDLPKIDAKSLEGNFFHSIIEGGISTEILGDTILVVTIPSFPGDAWRGRAHCAYSKQSGTSPRISLKCDRISFQDYPRLHVKSEFFGEDGFPGVPALRAINGSYYTNTGAQVGRLFIYEVLGFEK